MKPEVFVVKVEQFDMQKSRIDEIFAESPVAKMWDKVTTSNENWKKIHKVPETLEPVKKRVLGKLTTFLKCDLVGFALQRVALENKCLQEALIEEINAYFDELNSLKPEQITESNENFKRMLSQYQHEEALAKIFAESIVQCLIDECGDT